MQLARFLVLILPLVTQGCLLDIAPAREPLDATWLSHMLAGEYGTWFYGEKRSYVGPDKIESWPLGASGTRYGITVSDQSDLGGGGWSIVGGMVARVVRPPEHLELFGKEIARLHGLMQTSGDQDRRFEFFLVMRPNPSGPGRLVKSWSFPYEALGRAIPPALEKNLRAKYTGAELDAALARSMGIYINGYLAFEESSKTATVTITGLVQPFEERVDLARELP